MKATPLNLEEEIASLDPATARQFKETVFAMLQIVKAQNPREYRRSFSERIVNHPAIGTWPATLDVDRHIESLRDEWKS